MYVRPTQSASGYPLIPSELATAHDNICRDLIPRMGEFDAIVCAGDVHGIALASIAAAATWRPLMIICTHDHNCVVSHIVMFGEIHPEMNFLYMDDMFSFGASRKHVFDYMGQSGKCNIVATYEYLTREYKRIDEAS